jgi:hypothetical protein
VSEFQREKYIGEVAVLRREEQRGAFETVSFCAPFFGVCLFCLLLRCEWGKRETDSRNQHVAVVITESCAGPCSVLYSLHMCSNLPNLKKIKKRLKLFLYF